MKSLEFQPFTASKQAYVGPIEQTDANLTYDAAETPFLHKTGLEGGFYCFLTEKLPICGQNTACNVHFARYKSNCVIAQNPPIVRKELGHDLCTEGIPSVRLL